MPAIPTGYTSETFQSKNDLKRAVVEGRKLFIYSHKPDALAPLREPGRYTGQAKVIETDVKRSWLDPRLGPWVAKVDVRDGVIVKVY